MGEAHTRASKGRVCSALGHRPEMIFLGPGFLLGKSSAIFPWGALLLLRCSSWGNSLERAGVQVRSVDRRLKRIKTPGEVGLPRGNPHPQTTTLVRNPLALPLPVSSLPSFPMILGPTFPPYFLPASGEEPQGQGARVCPHFSSSSSLASGSSSDLSSSLWASGVGGRRGRISA